MFLKEGRFRLSNHVFVVPYMADFLNSVPQIADQIEVKKHLFALITLSLLLLWGFYADRTGLLSFSWRKPQMLGHVTHAYGTVKRTAWSAAYSAGSLFSDLSDSWNRLETGRSILAPLRSGDIVQTGEESASEILFFGGTVLRLEEGSLARFEEDDDSVSVRLIMGNGFLEMSQDMIAGKKLMMRGGDGILTELPKGARLVLSLGVARTLEEAMEVETIESDQGPDAFANVELRLLAHGEEVADKHAVLVPPLADRRRGPAADASGIGIPSPWIRFPFNEDQVDIETEKGVSFQWEPIHSPDGESITSYEIIVRPAFNYFVEDTARMRQVFRERKSTELPIKKVDGGGVFLWQVRAVTASGQRGPASTPRWLEIKFPKRLPAPKVIAPKIE